jgi:hypothetical protein
MTVAFHPLAVHITEWMQRTGTKLLQNILSLVAFID